ncbi:MAG: DUF3108 domain-containing protein [Syntrophales bacterium]
MKQEARSLFSFGPKRWVITFLICTSFALSALVAGNAGALDRKAPFQPGERLTYRAAWGVVPAGEVTLEILPMETVSGIEAYHFAMTTRTNDFVDLFYKIRERQDSYIDIGMAHSILYKKRAEGEHPRDVVINFDWDKREATRSNFGEKMAPIHIVPGTFDPLALFYVIRLQDIKRSPAFTIPITEGDRNIFVKATVSQRERIEIDGQTYETFAVVPDMERLETQQVVKKSDEAELKIWFTADDERIPVRIRSKVRVGHFDFDLVRREH